MMMIAPSHGEHGSASLYWGLGLSPSRVQGNWKAESNLKIEQYHALDSTIDHLVLSETSSITAYLLFTYAKTHIGRYNEFIGVLGAGSFMFGGLAPITSCPCF